MVGRFIIGKNNSFYRIIKNLDVLIIRGNFNKIKIPYKIGNLTIYGNYNKIEFLEGGEINFIKILGNNNEIFSPNVYRRNYIDRGLHNYFARLFNLPNRDRRSRSTRNNNNSTTGNLEEKLYLDIPHDIKTDNSNKCTLCDLTFLNFDKVKIFSCKKHIFHSICLEEYMRTNTNSSKCPRCENNNNYLNESTSSINPPLNSGQNPRNNSENNHNNNSNNLNNDNDMSEEDENSDMDGNNDEEESEDLESIKAEPLDKEIFDNLVISKIKDVEKLDNEKKQCAICLENYVKGDESIALPCIHIFHAKCIKTWLTSHNNCPSCKNEINYEMEDKNDEF
jgi:hypothetical protein